EAAGYGRKKNVEYRDGCCINGKFNGPTCGCDQNGNYNPCCGPLNGGGQFPQNFTFGDCSQRCGGQNNFGGGCGSQNGGGYCQTGCGSTCQCCGGYVENHCYCCQNE